MMIWSLILLLVPALPPAGFPPTALREPCRCAKARLINGWCRRCAVGYVGGVTIKSWLLFDYLDAHGHDIQPASLQCAGCQEALRNDGYCPRCRWGFVQKRLYFSRLTYCLGRGQVQAPAGLSCEACRQAAATAGWCERCAIGRIGPVTYTDRADYDAARVEYQRLLRAVEIADRCEFCALALLSGIPCVKCEATPQATQPAAVQRPQR